MYMCRDVLSGPRHCSMEFCWPWGGIGLSGAVSTLGLKDGRRFPAWRTGWADRHPAGELKARKELAAFARLQRGGIECDWCGAHIAETFPRVECLSPVLFLIPCRETG